MTDPGPPREENPDPEEEAAARGRELLGEATLLRLRGRPEEALARCREALQLRADDWEAFELLGDLALELGEVEEALSAYRRGKELNPSRTRLEEKLGIAALTQARAASLRQRSLDLAEGRIKREAPRKPALAALLSLLFPGLGQLYNRDLIKGTVLLCLMLLLVAGMFLSLLQQMFQLQRSGGAVDSGAIVSLFFQGGTLALFLVTLLIWVFAIIDAAFQASKTMTSDETGII